MPKVEDLFSTRFISAADIRKLKDPATPFVIRSVVAEECRNQRTQKTESIYVVYFSGGVKKAHRLRKKELPTVRKLGATTEEWIGKVVRFRIVDTSVGEGVRMMPDTGAEAPTEPAAEAEDLSFDGEIPQ